MATQRWYAGKAHSPDLRPLTSWAAESTEPGATIVTHLFMDYGGGVPTLYQLPVVERTKPLEGADSYLIGQTDDATWLYDGPFDVAYTRALLTEVAPSLADRFMSSAVMKGEQSNTSIVFTFDGAPPVICKVFRTLHNGENPDVTLQEALSAAGSSSVPLFVGQSSGQWPDSGQPTGFARGNLAFAQEFLPGAKDGWRFALDSTANVDGFVEYARALGTATADVHSTLAAVLPTAEASEEDIRGIVGAWKRRLNIASVEVPVIADHRAEIEAVYTAAEGSPWPRLQRIHGDLHLGQALWVDGRGWALVDFEGEPLRPMNERDRADSALRDVAGMLRSFDYAAGATEGWPVTWAAACRAAYLEGYTTTSGTTLESHQALLDAFELDKAVYEAIYEARNRPTWLGIPLRGIEQLIGD